MADTRARLEQAVRVSTGQGSSDFDLNPGFRPMPGTLRPAAVLVPVIDEGTGPDVLLTRRSALLRHHPGQIAFPGGKQDADDPAPEDAALREASEEIGLPANHARLIGRLASHETVTGFSVTPVVALIDRPFTPVAEAGEVTEVFRVPLSHVIRPENFAVEGRVWQGVVRRYYVVPYGPYYIWGATARILRGLAEAMA